MIANMLTVTQSPSAVACLDVHVVPSIECPLSVAMRANTTPRDHTHVHMGIVRRADQEGALGVEILSPAI